MVVIHFDGDITVDALKRQIFTVFDMGVRLGIAVLRGKAKVNHHVDPISALADAHQEILRLDVPVDGRFVMHVFNAGDKLISDQLQK